MSMTGEYVIELHNEAMANDANYRAEYEAQMADLDAYFAESSIDETEIDWFQDYRIDHTGYEEFGGFCRLCSGLNTKGTGEHRNCMNFENWLSNQF